jgi:pimeloyl-ACP methyl ester carboxylesterase
MPFAHLLDIAIYHEVLGAAGPALVLIQGYNSTKVEWGASQLQRRAARHRVVILDNRGVGQADRPEILCFMLRGVGSAIGRDG